MSGCCCAGAARCAACGRGCGGTWRQRCRGVCEFTNALRSAIVANSKARPDLFAAPLLSEVGVDRPRQQQARVTLLTRSWRPSTIFSISRGSDVPWRRLDQSHSEPARRARTNRSCRPRRFLPAARRCETSSTRWRTGGSRYSSPAVGRRSLAMSRSAHWATFAAAA